MSRYTLYRDGLLATMTDSSYGLIADGTIVIENGMIVWIGASKLVPQEYLDQSMQFSIEGYCITPGLIDCHTHLIYADNRANEFEERIQGASYENLHHKKRGIYSTVEAVNKASIESLFIESAKRLVQFIKEGVTTIEIKSGYGLNLENERKMLIVAKKLAEHFQIDIQKTFLGAHALPSEFKDKNSYIEYLLTKVIPILHQEQLLDALDGFCDEIAFNTQELEPLFRWAHNHHIPVKLHADQLSKTQGVELAAHYNALSVDHLEHLDEAGILRLKEKDIVAVLLPCAYYYLKMQKSPPIELLRQHQVRMAVSTDCNPGTSPSVSLLVAMNMSCVLFGLTPLEALQGVTVHAAKAVGLAERVGQLRTGFQADFVIWDIQHPKELAASLYDNRCLKVIKKGTPIYERN